MNLYLMQHGEAKPEELDPERPLSERGRTEVERVARAAARIGVPITAIRHSGKLRAKQTAEIVAGHVRVARGVIETAGMAPMDDPAMTAGIVADSAAGLLLVGHLPHLGRLASLLLVGDPDRPIIAFRMGGLVALAREQNAWRIAWDLTPDLVIA